MSGGRQRERRRRRGLEVNVGALGSDVDTVVFGDVLALGGQASSRFSAADWSSEAVPWGQVFEF